MALFSSRGERELAQFTRDALGQGVMRPDETWLSTATAALLSYTRMEAYTTRYQGSPSIIRLGFTSTRFVMLTDEEVVGVDLLMLSTAVWLHTEGKLPSAIVTWLGDQVPGMGGITVGKSSESTITQQFVRQLEATAETRKTDFPAEVVAAVETWRDLAAQQRDHDSGATTERGRAGRDSG